MSIYGSRVGIKGQDTIYIIHFQIKEEEKIALDREMRKGCFLGLWEKVWVVIPHH